MVEKWDLSPDKAHHLDILTAGCSRYLISIHTRKLTWIQLYVLLITCQLCPSTVVVATFLFFFVILFVFDKFVCIAVAVYDLVQSVETVFCCKVQTTSGNVVWNMRDARKTANNSFSESYIFQTIFPDAVLKQST